MKQDLIEIKTIGEGYIIIQMNSKGIVKRVVGKIKGRKTKSLLSSIGR